MQDKRTGADGAGGSGDLAAPERLQDGNRVRVLDGFAAYRMMQRRIADAAQRGIMMPFFQPRDGMSGATIRWHGRELINYSGYNYLGLSGHPAVSGAAKDAIDRYGTSASASRIVSGEIELHGVLERRLAAFLGTEDCLVFVSGYLTNLTVIGLPARGLDGARRYVVAAARRSPARPAGQRGHLQHGWRHHRYRPRRRGEASS